MINDLWLMELGALKLYLEQMNKLSVSDYQAELETQKSLENDDGKVKVAFGDFVPQTGDDLLEFNEAQTEARIKIHGVMNLNGPGFFHKLFGIEATGFNQIQEAIATVKDMSSVETVILQMDTPGGTAEGTDATFLALKDLALTKTLIVHNEGIVASAGFWLAMAAEKIIALNPSVETGSIGAVVVGFDLSGMMAKDGVKKVVITSSNAPNKALGVDTDEGKKRILTRLDAMERIFISRVSTGRNVSEETVRSDFGQGGVLVAEDPGEGEPDALSVGMIDEVQGSLKDTNNKDSNKLKSSIKAKEGTMDLLELMNTDAGCKAQIDAMLKAEFEKGQKDERDKIKARTEKAAPFLTADYGKPIQELAAKVISGQESPSALTGAVAVLDTQKEKESSDKAAAEAAKLGDTNPDKPDLNIGDAADGVIRTEDDLNKASGATVAKDGKDGDNVPTNLS